MHSPESLCTRRTHASTAALASREARTDWQATKQTHSSNSVPSSPRQLTWLASSAREAKQAGALEETGTEGECEGPDALQGLPLGTSGQEGRQQTMCPGTLRV